MRLTETYKELRDLFASQDYLALIGVADQPKVVDAITAACAITLWRARADSHGEAELREELAVTNKLLADRDELLQSIPPCPEHGNQCIPHAMEWVREQIRERREREEDAGVLRVVNPIAAAAHPMEPSSEPEVGAPERGPTSGAEIEALCAKLGPVISDETRSKIAAALMLALAPVEPEVAPGWRSWRAKAGREFGEKTLIAAVAAEQAAPLVYTMIGVTEAELNAEQTQCMRDSKKLIQDITRIEEKPLGMPEDPIMAARILADQRAWRAAAALPEPVAAQATVDALGIMRRSFAEDPQLARAWHVDLRGCIESEGAPFDSADAAAARFMRLAFGVDTQP